MILWEILSGLSGTKYENSSSFLLQYNKTREVFRQVAPGDSEGKSMNKNPEQILFALKLGIGGLVVGAFMGVIMGGFVGALIFGIPMGLMGLLVALFVEY